MHSVDDNDTLGTHGPGIRPRPPPRHPRAPVRAALLLPVPRAGRRDRRGADRVPYRTGSDAAEPRRRGGPARCRCRGRTHDRLVQFRGGVGDRDDAAAVRRRADRRPRPVDALHAVPRGLLRRRARAAARLRVPPRRDDDGQAVGRRGGVPAARARLGDRLRAGAAPRARVVRERRHARATSTAPTCSTSASRC